MDYESLNNKLEHNAEAFGLRAEYGLCSKTYAGRGSSP